MALIALVASAALGLLPVQIDRQFWFDTSRLSWTKKPYWGRIALTVDATGKPVACRVLIASGNRRFDSLICIEPMKSAVFRPATDLAGAPAAAVVEQTFAVNMPAPPPTEPVAFAVPISRMPEDATKPSVTLRVVTDTSNRVTGCAIIGSSGNRQLDRLACPAAMTADLPAVSDHSGSTLRAVRNVSLAFTVGPTSGTPP